MLPSIIGAALFIGLSLLAFYICKKTDGCAGCSGGCTHCPHKKKDQS